MEPDKAFWMNDGRKIESLVELARVLTTIDENLFRHHVSGTNNDFANWIEHVIGEKELADKLRKLKDSKQIAIAIRNHLKPPVAVESPVIQKEVEKVAKQVPIKVLPKPEIKKPKVTKPVLKVPKVVVKPVPKLAKTIKKVRPVKKVKKTVKVKKAKPKIIHTNRTTHLLDHVHAPVMTFTSISLLILGAVCGVAIAIIFLL